MTNHVCRDHYRPVSAKGTGCPECEADRAAHAARRDRRPADTQTTAVPTTNRSENYR